MCAATSEVDEQQDATAQARSGVNDFLNSFSSYGPDETQDFYIEVLNGLQAEDPRIQKEVAGILRELGKFVPEETMSAAIEAFNGSDQSEQEEALRVLGEQSGQAAYYVLYQSLIDKTDSERRALIADALSDVDEPWTFASLLHLVNDEDKNVRTAAAKSLKKLTPSFRLAVTMEAGEEVIELQPDGTVSDEDNAKARRELRDKIIRGGILPMELNNHFVGEGELHRDASPGVFDYLARYVLNGSTSPEDIQELEDIDWILHHGKGKLTTMRGFVGESVQSMNDKFRLASELPPTQGDILTGFTSNVDRSNFLTVENVQQIIDKAVEDAATEGVEELGKTREEVIKEIQDIIDAVDPNSVSGKVFTKSQVVGCVLRMFTHEGTKRSIVDRKGVPGSGKALAQWVDQTFNPVRDHLHDQLGGAPARIANFLAGIGEQYVTVYTPYQSSIQEAAYPNKHMLKFLGSDSIAPMDDPHNFNPEDPTKINFPVERTSVISVKFNGDVIQATPVANREIFTADYYGQKGEIISFQPLFRLSPDKLKEKAREIDMFIVNGQQYLPRSKTKEEYEEIATKLHDQLVILRDAGVINHTEFSGDTGRKEGDNEWSGIKYFEDVLRGTIQSMGINHSELKPVLQSIHKYLDPSVEVSNGDTPYDLYQNALALAKYLGVKRLHVHGQDLDITVREIVDSLDEKQEVLAMLHGKGRVVEWIENLPSTYPTPESRKQTALLRREGNVALLDFAETYARRSGYDKREQAQLMRSIAINGYAVSPDDPDYVVCVVPSKWIYLPEQVQQTTSAGDTISSDTAVQALLPWLNRTNGRPKTTRRHIASKVA